jgi:vacuolar-type H+-ATPase subunit E/Vma4
MDEAIIEDATIHMNASDYKIYKVLFEEMIKKSGYKSNISRDFVDIKGGFIIKKGKITIDCTLDSIIEAMYDEILMKINRMLVE